MKKKLNIAVVTSNRADYGLLYWLVREIHEDATLNLQLIVTGAHLSKTFGHTVKEIEQDGIPITARIKKDTVPEYIKLFGNLKPRILIVLGDRFEILSPASAAVYCRIPIVHIHGGEVTEGALDEQVRHALTKMAHIHFTSTEEYRKNVIQMGENPKHIFNLGAPGLEHLKKISLVPKSELEKKFHFLLKPKTVLVTLHPETVIGHSTQKPIQELLKALHKLKLRAIFTSPNNDSGGREILSHIQNFVKTHGRENYRFIPSLGHLHYLSLASCVDAVVGNSSSGIIEVPSLKTPTLNIGDRQKGRIFSLSTISCSTQESKISQSLQKILDPSFRRRCRHKNKYDQRGFFSKKAIKILKKILNSYANEELLHKSFHKVKF